MRHSTNGSREISPGATGSATSGCWTSARMETRFDGSRGHEEAFSGALLATDRVHWACEQDLTGASGKRRDQTQSHSRNSKLRAGGYSLWQSGVRSCIHRGGLWRNCLGWRGPREASHLVKSPELRRRPWHDVLRHVQLLRWAHRQQVDWRSCQ